MYEPKYTLTNRMVMNLVKLEVEKSQIESQQLTTQATTNLQLRSKAVNMFHLAHIIGVELTLKDAEKAAEGRKVKTDDARGIILNNFRNCIEFIRSNVTDTYVDIDINILLHLNKILLSDWKETWESKFRTGGEDIDVILDNWVNLRDNRIEAIAIQDELLQVLDWYKSSIAKVHNVIRVGVLLYRLIRVSPFIVANKLTVISVADYLLQKNGYLDKTFLPSTRNFDIYEDEYLEAWSKAIEHNDDLTLWLERFIRNLANDMVDTKDEVNRNKPSESRSSKQPFLDLNKRQLKILRYLQTIPTVKREDYVQMMDVSTMTAFRDLNALVKKKLLKVEGKGRGTRYMLSNR
ncbi:MAG: Fic family protein [Candidatus Dojkabacteria bacterium]